MYYGGTHGDQIGIRPTFSTGIAYLEHQSIILLDNLWNQPHSLHIPSTWMEGKYPPAPETK